MNISSTDLHESIPIADGAIQDCISQAQAEAFRANGMLVVRNVLQWDELQQLQVETLDLVERAVAERAGDALIPDVVYRKHELTGRRVPSRIEYVVDKSRACRALLAHPFILRSVEKLQGASFIPTWDSMVFKLGEHGAEIPWHRDADRDTVADLPIFNVDFYLDASNPSNCLWAIPGSNHWSDEQARAQVAALSQPCFRTEGALPLCMRPGDVLLHNILLVHGSPAATSQLRRVIYFEFRPAQTERQLGPHKPEYIPLKQRVLLECLSHRRDQPFASKESAFDYAPAAEFAPPSPAEPLPTLRIPHAEFM